MYRAEFAALLACALLWIPAAPFPQAAAVPLDDVAREEFLRKGRILRTRSVGKGVTASSRATLSLGELTHDAHIQTVDDSRREFKNDQVTEFNFRDKWQFNVAAYKIDRLIGLQLVPVTVDRRWNYKQASFTWWVDDVLMEEGERRKQNATAPDRQCWEDQMALLGVFDQLIDNVDRNPGNLIITRTWRLWAIDHTRAFRQSRTPPKPGNLTRVDRQVLARLASLDFATLKRETGRYIDDADIRALLSRRDAIVAHFGAGGDRVLYDRPDVSAGCAGATVK